MKIFPLLLLLFVSCGQAKLLAQKPESALISFHGDLTGPRLDQVMKELRQLRHTDPKLLQRTREASVELLQNAFRHAERDSDGSRKTYFFLIDQGGGYRIQTGNLIKEANYHRLAKRVLQLKALKPEELSNLYTRTLHEGEISAKGGAGLGLMMIVEASKGEVSLKALPHSRELRVLALEVTIAP